MRINRSVSLIFLLSSFLFAKVDVVVSYPYIGAICDAIGGDAVHTTVLAQADRDPHFIMAKPSLIAKMRSADALIINGASLETGWVPALNKRANNPKTHTSAKSFLDLSKSIDLIGSNIEPDRANGDVHPEGNPHFHLDPNNVKVIAQSVTTFLSSIDAEHTTLYEKDLARFLTQWDKHLEIWKERMARHKGEKVIQYHENFAYFLKAYGIESVATIEPLPGITPSSRDSIKLIALIQKNDIHAIVHDVYHSTQAARFLVAKTGVKLTILPHDVQALKGVDSLVDLFDHMTKHF